MLSPVDRTDRRRSVWVHKKSLSSLHVYKPKWRCDAMRVGNRHSESLFDRKMNHSKSLLDFISFLYENSRTHAYVMLTEMKRSTHKKEQSIINGWWWWWWRWQRGFENWNMTKKEKPKKMKKCCSAVETDGVGLLYTSSKKKLMWVKCNHQRNVLLRMKTIEQKRQDKRSKERKRERREKRTEHSRLCVCMYRIG